MGISSKKLHRWYKEVLSGFAQARENGEIGKDDLKMIEQGNYTNISVPIL